MSPQAPQRERVSMAALPLSKQERRAARRRRQRRWAHMLQPDKRMGVPQLMMLLEPNVVWDHTRAFVQELGVDVEAQYGRGAGGACMCAACVYVEAQYGRGTYIHACVLGQEEISWRMAHVCHPCAGAMLTFCVLLRFKHLLLHAGDFLERWHQVVLAWGTVFTARQYSPQWCPRSP
eukprot:scaffold138171_cov24-Tisochrysis_lutea.AAC.1